MKSWSSVLWLVQSKLRQEDSAVRMAEVFMHFGLNWGAFPLRPFDATIPAFEWDGPIIYYGSTNLIQIIEHRPDLRERAAFFYSPETHAASWYGPRLGSDWLNASARCMTVAEVMALPDTSSDFFVRPDAGVKLFAGKVMDVHEFRRLVDQAPSLHGMTLAQNTPVYVNEPIEIEMELRTWYIGGKIAAIVGYRRNGRIDPWDLDEDDPLRERIMEFALEQGAKLDEAKVFVLDVGVTQDGLKVVEINCIHTSGFYRTDHIHDVVCELTNYVREKSP